MAAKMGEKRNGIRSVEDIRLRCRICEETGCWEWRGSCQRRKDGTPDPRVWMADARTCKTLPNAVWTLQGKRIPPGWRVWRRCLNPLCGNPEHLMSGTTAAWGVWVSRKGYLQGRIERSIINRANILATGRSRITMEIAQAIRHSPKTGRELAAELGVDEKIISRIRTGKTFRVLTPTASIFAVADAMNAGLLERVA